MKKIYIAIAATIIASTCIFLACSKEEENDICGNTEKCLYEAECESIGIEHNAILTDLGFAMRDELDNCANLVNEHTFSPDDADRLTTFMQNNLREISFFRYGTAFSDDEWNIMTTLMDYTLSDEYFDKKFIGSKFESIVSGLLQDENIKSLDDMLLAVKMKKQELAKDICNEEAEATLAALTVFGYSLEFWNNAMYDESNPWHNIMMSFANNAGCEKALVGKLWKWFKEKVWEPIVKPVLFYTVTCDACGALSFLPKFGLSPLTAGIFTAGCSALGLVGGIINITR